MQTAHRLVGRLAGALVLMAMVAGCGAKPSAPATSAPAPTRAASPEKSGAPASKPAAVKRPGGLAAKSTPTPKKPTAPMPRAKPLPTKPMAPKAGPPAMNESEQVDRDQNKQKTFFYRAEPEADQSADKEQPYTVVKLYYATDRSPLDVLQWRQSLRGGWPLLTGLSAVLTAALMLWSAKRKKFYVRGLAWLSLAATLVLGGLTLAYRWQPESTDRQIERMYGNGRGELELGTCEVSVPKDHRTGALESPTVLRLEFREDPERHVVLLGVHPQPLGKFYADLRACVGRTARKEAFVFIHGYNVGFDTAVRRTAQIAYDLKFEGAPIVYSWPSQEGLLSYTVDETNVVWTVPHLKDFLSSVAEQSGAKSVHLIAHSMGNRALTSALHELAMERKADCPRFHEVVLTAPDIDADVFRRDLAPAIVKAADRVTLYASSNDEALIASRAVHGYRRAGESGDKLVVVPGVDTVDVSEVNTSLIGHSYYGSNSTVLADLFELMQGSKPPDQRRWLQSMRLGALKYWKFLGEQTGLSPPGEEL